MLEQISPCPFLPERFPILRGITREDDKNATLKRVYGFNEKIKKLKKKQEEKDKQGEKKKKKKKKKEEGGERSCWW